MDLIVTILQLGKNQTPKTAQSPHPIVTILQLYRGGFGADHGNLEAVFKRAELFEFFLSL